MDLTSRLDRTATANSCGSVIERHVLRAVNRLVGPVVRVGLGNSLAGPGVFLVETIGRRSGTMQPVPLLGARFGNTIVVGTVRPASQWVRNVDHTGHAAVWVGGCRHPATATVSWAGGVPIVRLTLGARPERLNSTMAAQVTAQGAPTGATR
jgi:hypothetical protein